MSNRVRNLTCSSSLRPPFVLDWVSLGHAFVPGWLSVRHTPRARPSLCARLVLRSSCFRSRLVLASTWLRHRFVISYVLDTFSYSIQHCLVLNWACVRCWFNTISPFTRHRFLPLSPARFAPPPPPLPLFHPPLPLVHPSPSPLVHPLPLPSPYRLSPPPPYRLSPPLPLLIPGHF